MSGYNQLREKLRDRGADRPSADPSPAPSSPYFSRTGARPAARSEKAAHSSRSSFEINKKLLIAALGLSALASLMAMSYLQSSAGVLSQKSQLIPVVVAVKDIPARTVLKAEMFGVRDVPASYVVQGALGPRDDFLGKITLTPLYSGEQVLKQRVSSPSARTGLTSAIPEGYRALTIDVNSASGLAGLLKPGDFIDMISTIRAPHTPDKMITTPILQRAKVLAVGSRVSGENGVEQDISEGISAGQTVTLSVPDQKVNLITMLEARGNLKIVLRSAQDETVMPETFSDAELEQMLLGQKQLPPPPPEQQPIPEPRPVASVRPYTPPRATAPRAYRVSTPATPRPHVVARKVVVQKVVQVPVPAAQPAQPPPQLAPPRSIEIISGTKVTEHKI